MISGNAILINNSFLSLTELISFNSTGNLDIVMFGILLTNLKFSSFVSLDRKLCVRLDFSRGSFIKNLLQY